MTFHKYGFFSLFIYLEVSLTGVRWFGLYNITFLYYYTESLFFFICMDCLLATRVAPVAHNLLVGFMTSWYCHETCPFYVGVAAFFCQPYCSSFFQLCPWLLNSVCCLPVAPFILDLMPWDFQLWLFPCILNPPLPRVGTSYSAIPTWRLLDCPFFCLPFGEEFRQ